MGKTRATVAAACACTQALQLQSATKVSPDSAECVQLQLEFASEWAMKSLQPSVHTMQAACISCPSAGCVCAW
jgi:hypothetical protein